MVGDALLIKIYWLQVLQRQMDLELELLEGKEERKSVLGRLYMLSLSSQVEWL